MSNELLDLIKKGESGAAGYNAYNRGTHGKRVIPANQRIDFSEMTIEDLQRRQNLPKGEPPDFTYDRVLAVGKYQIIPDTLKLAVNHLQLKGDEKFSQETQDRIFSEYLIVSKRKAIHGYITDDPAYSLESARRALSEEWASFPDPRKPGAQSYYPAPNRAHITHDEVIYALNSMKRQYADRITLLHHAADAEGGDQAAGAGRTQRGAGAHGVGRRRSASPAGEVTPMEWVTLTHQGRSTRSARTPWRQLRPLQMDAGSVERSAVVSRLAHRQRARRPRARPTATRRIPVTLKHQQNITQADRYMGRLARRTPQ